jgi:hypothetical protein
MKTTLKLTNPLWSNPQRKRILDKAVQESAAELEKEIKQTILDSVPRGKTYRRGAITRSRSARNIRGLKLQTRGNKAIVGSRFHRASAKGQPPAVDTGGLINSVRARRYGVMKARVSAGKLYAPILDDPKKLNRPFFASVAEKFRPKFKQNIQEAIARNS